MPNLLFTLWMLLFPVTVAVCTWIYEVKVQRPYTPAQRTAAVAADLITWLTVGFLLYGK